MIVNYSDSFFPATDTSVSFTSAVSSEISLSEASSFSFYYDLKIYFKFLDSLNSNKLVSSYTSDILSFLNKVYPSSFENILSTFITGDFNSLKTIVSTSEDFTILEAISSYFLKYDAITSHFHLDSDLNNRLNILSRVSESLLIKVPTGTIGEYSTYSLSPETKGLTTYTNYNFDGSCETSKGDYLFYNSQGIYKYGGKYDDGDNILMKLKTSAITLGNDYLKSIPNAYLGITSDKQVILKVSVDGKGTFTYKLNKHTNNLRTQKVAIGKGIKGHYYQFELITDSTNLSLDTMEFLVVTLRREI